MNFAITIHKEQIQLSVQATSDQEDKTITEVGEGVHLRIAPTLEEEGDKTFEGAGLAPLLPLTVPTTGVVLLREGE